MRSITRFFVSTLAGFGFLFIPTATATAAFGAPSGLTEWGTEAFTSVADCPSFCTNFNFGPGQSNPEQTSASDSVSEFRGSADAEANLAGGLAIPVLKARGNANPSMKGALATAFGSQGYTYNGANTTLTLDVTLTGSLVDPDATPRAGIRATVAIFQTTNYFFLSDIGTLILEGGAIPVQQVNALGDAILDLQLLDTGSINETQSLIFDASDGDQFYIWALLDAEAVSSSTAAGSADAFNTLTMSFADPTGLTPASNAVPAPATSSLLLCGLLAWAVGGRRRHGVRESASAISC